MAKKRARGGTANRFARYKRGGSGWTNFDVPEGLSLYKPPRKGIELIDIVLYVYKGGICETDIPNRFKFCNPGEWYWERTYKAHYKIGLNGDTYVCPLATISEPCPICQYVSELGKERTPENVELIKKIKAKERQMFLVSPIRQGEDREVLLWDTSPRNFGNLLQDRSETAPEDEDWAREFDDPEEGATLRVTFAQESMGEGANTYTKAIAIDFKRRKNGLPEELLDHGYCLDDILRIHDFDTIKTALEGGTPDTDDTEEREEPKRRESDSDDDNNEEQEWSEGDQVRHRRYGVCEVLKVLSSGRIRIKDEDGDTYRVDPDDLRKEDGNGGKSKKDDDDDDEFS